MAVEACRAPTPEAEAGVERSRWSEFDANGLRLVRETGTLRTVALGLAGDCGAWQWQGRWQHAQGTRGYDGASNNGVPLHTTSGIRRERANLQAWRSFGASHAVGVEGRWTQLHRDIASIGGISGYPERFSAWQAALGARHTWAEVGGTNIGLEAWLGGGPAGHVDVALPGLDDARLKLGVSRSVRVGLSLSSPDAITEAAGWHWRVRLEVQQDRTRIGRPQALYRQGALYGAAVQPKFEQVSASLSAALAYRF